MARTKSPYQIAKEALYEKRAIELYKDGNSYRKVALLLKVEGINKSYEWVRDVLNKHGIIPLQNQKNVA
jgi:hypothetical protein